MFRLEVRPPPPGLEQETPATRWWSLTGREPVKPGERPQCITGRDGPRAVARRCGRLCRLGESLQVDADSYQHALILADDNAMLVRSLAKRGYLDVLKRRVPLYRVNDLGREALRLTS